ncbi:Glycosyltransferase involved in cell wall bisynthesis [Formivibrio citricus]|uniref:Glycosyltransferase involved in cell wall bisynthesis n=1 Tax=Formivibrio citricus TaxID=83765 RepID=A0A1I4UVT5_9NEIS|nr:glycosyltransferase family 2 protein [Formivibrio citricus]SFM93127.1 Glycosyltransferase involved in cell wall bisynthesis [Formivibrio citricus]
MSLFSIVLPTHNRAELLQRAVNSVLGQKFRDFELVIVDDGSSDGTREWLASLAEDRIRILRHETPRGASAARNTGIRAATGEWIAFLDDDDEYWPEFLERHHALIQQHPEAGWHWSGIRRHFWHSDGQVECRDQVWLEADTNKRYLTQLAASYGLLIRKTLLEQVGGFDESMPVAEDLDLLFRLETAGHIGMPVPEVLLNIHLHAGASLSRGRNYQRFVDSYRILVKKNQSFLERYPQLWQHYHDSLVGHLYRIGDHQAARRLVWQIFRRAPWKLAGIGKLFRFEIKRLKTSGQKRAA